MGTTPFTHDIERRIEDIRNDRMHGSTFLATEALRTLTLVAEAVPLDKEYISVLRDVSRRLAHARPAMAAIKNVVGRFLDELEQEGKGLDPRVLERRLLDEMESASRETAHKAAEVV